MKATEIVNKLDDAINEKEEVFVKLKASHNEDVEAMNQYRRLNYEMVNVIEELTDKAFRYEKMAGYVEEDTDK